MTKKTKTPSDQLAKTMAELTCMMAKTCNKKENQFAASFNLTPAEFKFLRLFSEISTLPIKKIRATLDLTPGRITHIITSLEKKNLIKRHQDPNDKRNVFIDLTNVSIPFIRNLHKNHIDIHKKILENIPPEKRESVISAMEDVISALKKWSNSQDQK